MNLQIKNDDILHHEYSNSSKLSTIRLDKSRKLYVDHLMNDKYNLFFEKDNKTCYLAYLDNDFQLHGLQTYMTMYLEKKDFSLNKVCDLNALEVNNIIDACIIRLNQNVNLLDTSRHKKAYQKLLGV